MSAREDWQEVLTDAVRHRSLSDRERNFVESLIGRPAGYELSEKQEAWLRDIEHKIYQVG